MEEHREYKALHALIVIYRIAGVMMAVFGGLGLLSLPNFSGGTTENAHRAAESIASGLVASVGIAWAAGWSIAGLSCYACGELIQVFIEIAENTRPRVERLPVVRDLGRRPI